MAVILAIKNEMRRPGALIFRRGAFVHAESANIYIYNFLNCINPRKSKIMERFAGVVRSDSRLRARENVILRRLRRPCYPCRETKVVLKRSRR